MLRVSLYLSIFIININGSNIPVKRHRVAEWIKKKKTQLYAAYKTFTSALETQRIKYKSEGVEKEIPIK